MAPEYYLRRDDNRTLFLLGKGTGDWEEFLGDGVPTIVGPVGEPALARAIAERVLPDLAWPARGASAADRARSCGLRVARMIVSWAGGRPFRFVSEHGFEGWEGNPGWDYRRAVTGTRHLLGGFPDLGERRCLVRDDYVAYALLVGATRWGNVLGYGTSTRIRPGSEDRLADGILGKLSADPRWGPFEFPDGEELPGGLEGYARHVARSIVAWSGDRSFQFVDVELRECVRPGADRLIGGVRMSGACLPITGTRALE